jgi:REP element-mobilizing transposase RayT
MNTYDLEDTHLNLREDQYQETKKALPLFQTKEEGKPDLQPDVVFEMVHSECYELSFTCLLIPRFPSHQLKGDLANYLPDWLQQICVSFSWPIEFTTVDPGYFQWGLRANASTAPTHIMQTIRSETSKMVLSTFGKIARENLSDDFWAPGHLVVLGIRPHSDDMITQYIRMIRKQQGLITLDQLK